MIEETTIVKSPYIKTIRDVLAEIHNIYGSNLDARVMNFKLDVKDKTCKYSLSYNEREVNKRLDREGAISIKV